MGRHGISLVIVTLYNLSGNSEQHTNYMHQMFVFYQTRAWMRGDFNIILTFHKLFCCAAHKFIPSVFVSCCQGKEQKLNII